MTKFGIKVLRWRMPATRRNYSAMTKFVGQVFEDGQLVAETGKCLTYSAAYTAAERKLGVLEASR